MADEYISREAALKYIKSKQCRTCSDIGLCGNCAVLVAVKLLEKVPAADVAPVRHGHWIGEGDGYADGELVFNVWHCSECDYCIDDGTDDPEHLPKYCPGCGALMDGGNEGE